MISFILCIYHKLLEILVNVIKLKWQGGTPPVVWICQGVIPAQQLTSICELCSNCFEQQILIQNTLAELDSFSIRLQVYYEVNVISVPNSFLGPHPDCFPVSKILAPDLCSSNLFHFLFDIQASHLL